MSARQLLAEAIRDIALMLLALADRIDPVARAIVLPQQRQPEYEGDLIK